jgi:hypothetical protein
MAFATTPITLTYNRDCISVQFNYISFSMLPVVSPRRQDSWVIASKGELEWGRIVEDTVGQCERTDVLMLVPVV